MFIHSKKTKYSGFVIFVVILSMIIPLAASADYSGTLIRCSCDRVNDQIVIEYTGGVNKAFNELMRKKGPNAWYPWDLVVVDKNQQRIVKTKAVFRSCRLSDGEYKITIGPEPGNCNIHGHLGARMSAWVKISKDGKQIIRKIMEDVRHWDQPIISKIVLNAKASQPVITEIKADNFYK